MPIIGARAMPSTMPRTIPIAKLCRVKMPIAEFYTEHKIRAQECTMITTTATATMGTMIQ